MRKRVDFRRAAVGSPIGQSIGIEMNSIDIIKILFFIIDVNCYHYLKYYLS